MIGGRNQKTQPCLKPCVGGGVAAIDSVREVLDARGAGPFDVKSFSCFSVVGVLADPTTLPKSSTFPGDFEDFEDAPKDAKAPDPKPNALDAPTVGDAMAVVDGDMELKGFLLLWEELSPCLLPSV